MADLEAIAYHEAGHAVAAWDLHCPFKHVTIVPDDASLGRCEGWGPSPAVLKDLKAGVYEERTCRWIEREIISFLAGAAAEEKFTGYPIEGDEHDKSCVYALVIKVIDGEEEMRAYLEYLRVRTKGLITYRWAGVEALATALLQKRTLTARAARHVIRTGLLTAVSARRLPGLADPR